MKSWLELVADYKRAAPTQQRNWSGATYLDLLRKRVRYSKAGSPGSKPTESKSDANPKQASFLPRIKHGE